MTDERLGISEEEREIKRREMEIHNQPNEDASRWDEEMDRSLMQRLDDYGPKGEFGRLLQDEITEGRVLDYCCGEFPRSRLLSDSLPIDVVGIDISEAQLKIAREKVDGEFAIGDVEYLPYQSDSFDAIIASLALHHLPQWDGLVLDELARVLTDDGVIVFREPLKYNPFAAAFRLMTETKFRTPNETPLPPRKLIHRLEDTFEEVEVDHHYIAAPILPFISKFLPQPIPMGVLKTVYDAEKWILDRGAGPIAVAVTGVARNPRR